MSVIASAKIEEAFRLYDNEDHHEAEVVVECGHSWVVCKACNAEWAIKMKGTEIKFIRTEEGDCYCLDHDGDDEDDDVDDDDFEDDPDS